MKPYKAMAHIHSLNGEIKEVTVLENDGGNNYIVEYNGVKCTAIFNPFAGRFYVDDKYGVIRDRPPVKDDMCL